MSLKSRDWAKFQSSDRNIPTSQCVVQQNICTVSMKVAGTYTCNEVAAYYKCCGGFELWLPPVLVEKYLTGKTMWRAAE